MFIDEWRPKFKGDKATEEHLDNIEKEYGSKCGAAFERLIRAASEAGIWLDAPAMKALEEKRGLGSTSPLPSTISFLDRFGLPTLHCGPDLQERPECNREETNPTDNAEEVVELLDLEIDI